MTTVKGCEPNTQAVESICAQIGEEKGKDLTLNTDVEKPVICDYYTDMYIVTTPELLDSKLTKKHTQYYATTGQTFQFVGPLMFSSSSTSKQATVAADLSEVCVGRLFKRVDDALAAGQRTAYVSLGTLLTSTQDKRIRWERCAGESSISWKELWQAVFRAVFALLEDEILFY